MNTSNSRKVIDFFKKNMMIIIMVLMVIFFESVFKINGMDASLLSPRSITNIINQNAYVFILATGMLICILTGGNIDLSVGSGLALVGSVAGKMMVDWKPFGANETMNVVFTIAIAIILGLAIGGWQGYWIAYARIPAFIVTLAGQLMFRGIAQFILDGQTVNMFPELFLNIFKANLVPADASESTKLLICLVVGAVISAAIVAIQLKNIKKRKAEGYIDSSMLSQLLKVAVSVFLIMFISYKLGKDGGFSIVLIYLAIIILVYNYFTQKTVPGRYLYAVGGNEKAAKLSGINTDKVLFGAYLNMGFLVAVTSLIAIARNGSVAPAAGNGYELDAIASCYIGGASAYGGVGTVSGAVIGAVFMGILNIGMSYLGIGTDVQSILKGGVLLFAVAFDVIAKNRSKSA